MRCCVRPTPPTRVGDTGSQNRFTALRQFRLLACTASAPISGQVRAADLEVLED